MAVNYIYEAAVTSDLYANTFPDETGMILMGNLAIGDQPRTYYLYSSSSTATDDGVNVIQPTAIGPGLPGRWLKQGSTQTQSDWNETNNTKPDYIWNKPVLAAVATSGAYSDVTGKPVLATVATSGSYNDLSSKPTIPAAQVQTDWNASTGLGVLLNKPSLATVATSGNYSDLSGKPSLATVATSGAYADLSGKPTIPAAQVQTDWNATTGLGVLLNKPSLATVATSGSYTDLSNKPTINSGTVTSVGVTGSDFSISNTPITTSGNIAMALAASGISAGNYSGVTVTTKGIVTAGTNRSFNSTPARLISTTGSNNTFTINSTRDAQVSYTINFAAALTLTTSNGKVQLDYSTNGGSTWTTIASVSQVFGVSITITTNQDMVLHGVVPANALVRLYSSSATNTTITAGAQQEVLL